MVYAREIRKRMPRGTACFLFATDMTTDAGVRVGRQQSFDSPGEILRVRGMTNQKRRTRASFDLMKEQMQPLGRSQGWEWFCFFAVKKK